MRFFHGRRDGSGMGRGRGYFGEGDRQERLRRCEGRMMEGSFPLAELPEGERAKIVINPDEQTVGMGLFSGQIIRMSKNDANEDNLVVCVGETRLIVPKKTGMEIVVR